MTEGENNRRHWQVLDHRLTIDRSPYLRVYDEDVQLPDGQIITNWTRVYVPEFVVMFALLDDGRVSFVEQFRQAVGCFTLELPSGGMESDEEPLLAAQRELREETGVEAPDWRFMGRYVMDTNRECGYANVFLAQHAALTVPPDPGDVGEMRQHLLTLAEIRQRFEAGQFVSAPTALTVGLALSILTG